MLTPTRSASLGLQIPMDFELKLLETALKGKKVFESFWEKESAEYDVRKRVICLEILLELEAWEKDGNLDPLERRVNELVQRLKRVDINMYNRGMVVYGGILEFKNSQIETLDAKFETMLTVDLPQTMTEETNEFRTPRSESQVSVSAFRNISLGVAGVSSTLGNLRPNFNASEELSIFQPPKENEANHPSTIGCVTAKISNIGEHCSETQLSDSILMLGFDGDLDTCTNNGEKTPQESQLQLKDCFKTELIEEVLSIENDDELKLDSFASEKISGNGIVISNFPVKEFKDPLEWTVGQSKFKVTSIAELRIKHHVLVEGNFRKRCRGLKWRKYFGFLIGSGVMIYFRDGIFKKVADFRNSTISKLDGKQFRINFQNVYVDSKPTQWLLEFCDADDLNLWYEKIFPFCNGIR